MGEFPLVSVAVSNGPRLPIAPVPAEERVVPIEVCRSKLSKYLQGVVFRCDKCTFTCSSDESLQQHIEKHNELKPYKCQLCYYEAKHTEELDSHLRDEHKVLAGTRCPPPTLSIPVRGPRRAGGLPNVVTTAVCKAGVN